MALLPHPRGLTSDRVTAEREQIMVEAHVAGSGARCPHCSAHARRVHRRYRRTIADLPLAERRTTCPCGCAASVAHNRAAHGCPSSRRWPTWPPVNVLPGCVAGDFATRLATHPGTEIICRDRGGYAEGARRGAPAAAQVADRFHLLQNLGAALERLRAPPCGVADEAVGEVPPADPKVRGGPGAANRRARYAAIQEHMARGIAIGAVARALKPDRKTIRRYARAAVAPAPATRPRRRRSILDPFLAHPDRRWGDGCRSALTLH